MEACWMGLTAIPFPSCCTGLMNTSFLLCCMGLMAIPYPSYCTELTASPFSSCWTGLTATTFLSWWTGLTATPFPSCCTGLMDSCHVRNWRPPPSRHDGTELTATSFPWCWTERKAIPLPIMESCCMGQMATPFLTWGYDIVKFSDFSSALSSVGTI